MRTSAEVPNSLASIAFADLDGARHVAQVKLDRHRTRHAAAHEEGAVLERGDFLRLVDIGARVLEPALFRAQSRAVREKRRVDEGAAFSLRRQERVRALGRRVGFGEPPERGVDKM